MYEFTEGKVLRSDNIIYVDLTIAWEKPKTILLKFVSVA